MEFFRGSLEPHCPDLSGFIELEEEGIHELLDLVFVELANSDARLLVVFDDFD